MENLPKETFSRKIDVIFVTILQFGSKKRLFLLLFTTGLLAI